MSKNAIAVVAAEQQLVVLREVVAALRLVQSVDEAKEIRDRHKAMEVYAKQRDDAGEAQRVLGEIRLRAERRLGELLGPAPDPKESGKKGGRGKRKAPLHEEPFSSQEASRLRRLASVPEARFESAIAEAAQRGEVPSVASLVAPPDAPKKIAKRVRDVASKLAPGSNALIALALELEEQEHRKAPKIREALGHVKEARRILQQIADIEENE